MSAYIRSLRIYATLTFSGTLVAVPNLKPSLQAVSSFRTVYTMVSLQIPSQAVK